jgi:hypothetical protein
MNGGGGQDYFPGKQSLDEALRLFGRFVSRARLPEEEISPIASELEALRPDPDGWKAALRMLYRGFKEELPGLMAKGPPLTSRFVLKPNKTLRLFADSIRSLIADPKGSVPHRSGTMVFENYGGKWLLDEYLQHVPGVLAQVRCARAWLPAARTSLALRRYQLVHGELPAKLDELVPRFLKEVPKDPYDGRPLRYSKEKKSVWSVGEDGVDSGGRLPENAGSDAVDPSEPTFRIEF